MLRRAFLLALALSPLACRAKGSGGDKSERCSFCGMKIDPASAWLTELVMTDGTKTTFDTPRCAMTAWRTRGVPAKSVRVQEFYERVWRDGTEVDFVIGSDVAGPMGADLVPVAPSKSAKFMVDHAAARAVKLDAITPDLLKGI
ncbi:MAG: nitrous oxide reductase accessory protein NosL [Polyangiaceae bacterium]